MDSAQSFALGAGALIALVLYLSTHPAPPFVEPPRPNARPITTKLFLPADWKRENAGTKVLHFQYDPFEPTSSNPLKLKPSDLVAMNRFRQQ